jgi:hypothetical protein
MALVGTINSPNDFGFKNRIINGDMRIDQRNAGASVTASVTATQTYTSVDRWAYQASQASKFTVQQNAASITPPVGFKNYLGITSSAATSLGSSDYFLINQCIEGFNVADLGWGTANAKTVTLSFQVYSSLTGTFGGSILNSATNRSYPFTYSISTANTWTSISITIAGDTSGTWLVTNGIGMFISFSLGMGSTYSGTAGAWAGTNYYSATGATSVVGTNGATFYITGVQLEKGSTATSFDYRSYGTELAMCQRYFWVEPTSSFHPSILDGNNSDYPSAWVSHPVEMRATPSATFQGLGAFYYNSGSAGVSFTPSGGTTSYGGNARSGYAIKNLISNPAGSTHGMKVGQWSVLLSFSAEL